jgi:signal transduction histidine kinase/ActR/RegA family two-component response regulator
MSDDDASQAKMLREALDAFEDSVAIYGPNGEHLYSSRSAKRHYQSFYEALDGGADHWEAVAQAVRRRMPHLPAHKVEAYVAFNKAKYKNGETYSLVTDDGRNVQVTYRALSDGRKAGISVDVTSLLQREQDLERARAEAEAASAAKSAFLANMSHELRTPLNGVLGMAQALGFYGLPPEQRALVEVIMDSGRQLLAVVNDILDLTKITAGKMDINPVETDLGAHIRAAVDLYRAKAEEKGLKLGLVLDDQLPPQVILDPVRVRQCVHNLLSNAIKFTETGRVIVACRLMAERNDELLAIEVVDTGIGMAREQVSRLFQDFSQLDESTTRQFGGTGVGLSIAMRLARAMGGDLTVKSRPGHGSIFQLVLPAQAVETAQMESARRRERQRLRGARVLVVDDNATNRRVAEMFLTSYGLLVSEAVNGAQALAKLECETFDIVLLDVHMPAPGGVEVLKRIRASTQPWADIPIVMLTADAMNGDRERYLGIGADGYLPKPIDQRELLAVMASAMQMHANRSAA